MEKVKEVINGLIIAASLFSIPYLISRGWYSGKRDAKQ
jgi:hypothetical protein